MSPTLETMRQKAAFTYNAAADHFDDEPLSFWARHGRRTVALLDLVPGARVLDVGCGTGASALPAAAAVGANGHVTGIDVAENMLVRARAKAAALGFKNVSFALTDMAAGRSADERFDAVISVFSVFFVPDIVRQISMLWELVRPGGQLALTVWARRAFEPAVTIFGEELRRERPDLTLSGRPWERLTEPNYLRHIVREGGAADPTIEVIEDCQPVPRPADWWTIVMGSGYRWEVDQLSPDQREAVRTRTLRRLDQQHVTTVETSAICAIARKPA